MTPVPYMKLFPLCLSRLSEGFIYSVVFPYINQMIHEMGIEEKKVGVWSATAVSIVFSAIIQNQLIRMFLGISSHVD